MYYNKNENISRIILISKKIADQKLEKYLKKNILNNEFCYYLNDPYKNILSYVIDPKDCELTHIICNHISIINEFINTFFAANILDIYPLKIALIDTGIFFDNVFVIDDYMYINYQNLKNIFIKIEEYNITKKSIPINMFIHNNILLNKELIKNITTGIINIIQYANINKWINYIMIKYNCNILPLDILPLDMFELVEEKNKYYDPNYNFLNDYIITYNINNKIYTYVPYWDSSKEYNSYYDFKYYQIINNKLFLIDQDNNDISILEAKNINNPFKLENEYIINILYNFL